MYVRKGTRLAKLLDGGHHDAIEELERKTYLASSPLGKQLSWHTRTWTNE